ncbi:hypothetical protein LXL04_014539 [Taraxacum kok-saghyz]
MEEKINPNEVKSEKNPDLQRRAIAVTLLAATIGNSGDAFNRAPLWTVDRLQKSPAKINPKSFTEIQVFIKDYITQTKIFKVKVANEII